MELHEEYSFSYQFGINFWKKKCKTKFLFGYMIKFLSLSNTVEDESLSKIMQEHGYPKKHPHRLACLRQELIEAFVE